MTIAVTAVLVFAGLTLWRTKHTVGRLADDRRTETAETIARTIALSYQQTGSWTTTDIHPASMLAVQAGATITVTDNVGRELTLPSSMGPMNMATPDLGPAAVTKRVPVIVDGSTVGTVIVAFTNGELALAEQHVRDALRGTVALGALIAALAAIAVAVPLSRRILAPLTRITVSGDRTQLVQIITNLLTNAIKYTPPGGTIHVGVTTDPTTSMGVLTVTDNGPGINDHDHPHVVERFHRADQTRHITGTGTGIGLALAQQLVTAHHGTITIDTTPANTTTVDTTTVDTTTVDTTTEETAAGTTVGVCIPLERRVR